MRTDVKIGLIALVVVILAGVAFYGFSGKEPKNHPNPVGPQQAQGPVPSSTDAVGDGGMSISMGTSTTAPSTVSSFELGGPLATSAPGHDAPAGVATTASSLGGPSLYESAPTSRPGAASVVTTRSVWPSGELVTTRPGGAGLGSLGTSGLGGDALGSTLGTTDTETVGTTTYKIARGDTLAVLARRNHTTVKAIQAANPGLDPAKLKIGQVIQMPAGTAAESASAGTPRESATPSTRTSTHRSVSTPTAASTRSAAPGGTYTVRRGDSLRVIAKRVYGDEKYWERVARVNRSLLHGDPNSLRAGMVLQLPER